MEKPIINTRQKPITIEQIEGLDDQSFFYAPEQATQPQSLKAAEFIMQRMMRWE